jgi:hypothetical protein
MQQGPHPISLASISEDLLKTIAKTLRLDITQVQPEEWRIGIIEELDKMMVYTSAGMNHEKLAKAALTSYENLQTHPSFYTNPPNQEIAHVLTGRQFGHPQYENLERYIDGVLNEDFASIVSKLKAAPAELWAKAKAKLTQSSGLFKKLLSKSVSKIEAGAAKLKPLVAMIKQAEQETGEKLPTNQTIQAAMALPAKAKAAEAEIAQQKSAVAALPQAQPGAQQEACARQFDAILVEAMAVEKKPLNEALGPTVIIGFVLALIGGIPMLINGLHKLATKLTLTKTADMLAHMHHVTHSFEQKAIDYIIPDILSYALYTKFWKAGIKVRGSKAFDKPLSREEYTAGEGNVRGTVESIIYKIMLVWFLAQGIRGAWSAGTSLLGLAEGAASSVKAVEIAAVVTQVAEILGPDALDAVTPSGDS